MHPAGKASGGGGADRSPREDDGGRDAAQEPDETAEIRRVLGVESAFGYHVEGGARRMGRAIVVRERPAARKHSAVEAARSGAVAPSRDAGARAGAFPCLDGPVYAGCLGAGCPLE